MEEREHPTHNWPVAIACGLLAPVNVVLFVAYFREAPKVFQSWFGGAFFVQILAVIVWTAWRCRKIRCRQCGRVLRRDVDADLQENRYPCADCGIVWKSKVVWHA
jgi:hypothetical protein